MSKKQSIHLHLSRVVLALFICVVSVPAFMPALFRSTDVDGSEAKKLIELEYQDQHQRAYNDRARVRMLRRNYWRAVDIYNELVRLGVENLVPPHISDMESIEYYLDPSNFIEEDAYHTAAPVSIETVARLTDAQLAYNALPEKNRDLLDGYLATGRCPGSLRSYYLDGFYDLCRQLLAEQKEATMPNRLQRSAYLRGFQPLTVSPIWNLKERLSVLEESLSVDGAAVRPRTHSGYRPRLQR